MGRASQSKSGLNDSLLGSCCSPWVHDSPGVGTDCWFTWSPPDVLALRLTQLHPDFTLCHTGVAGAQATEQAGELAMANMEAKAQRGAEEELKRRQESKLNDYQGYVADVWGADTAKPDELDAKKVRGRLTGDRVALG